MQLRDMKFVPPANHHHTTVARPSGPRLAKRHSALKAAACALALFFAPALAMAAEPAAATRPPLTLAVADLLYAAPVLIAESQGYFAAEGLPLNIIRCPVGRICLQHLMEGQAQFATVGDTPVALASFTRQDFAIIATTTTSGGELRMVARKDRGIDKAADLRGRRIAIIQGTTSHYFVDTFLRFHGLKAADVTLVPLQPSAVAASLVRGDVDAAGLFEPWGRDAVRQLGDLGRVLPSPRFFTLVFNFVSAGPKAGVSADDEVRVLRALRRADALIRDDPERARSILAGVLKLEPAKLAETWGDFEFRLQLGQPLINTLEAQARWAQREGLAPANSRMPNFLNLINSDPLQRVDPQAMRLIR